MKKFSVELAQRGWRSGFYTVEAPDADAALVLAGDISFNDPRIEWDIFEPAIQEYPTPEQLAVVEVKE